MTDLKLEKNIKVAVEVNGEGFIGIVDGALYQSINDNEAFFYIKDNGGKEIKIKMTKNGI